MFEANLHDLFIQIIKIGIGKSHRFFRFLSVDDWLRFVKLASAEYEKGTGKAPCM